MDIAGLLLCGGAARRFGANKLLAGEVPLAVRAARNLIAGCGHALAVMPLGEAKLRAALEAEGCEILESDRTVRGIGASLAAGVEASESADGWIVALGDMPLVKADTIRRVKRALQEGALIAAPFDGEGRRGHPVGFSAALRDALLDLDGDLGARELLGRHRDEVERVAVDDPGIFVDVDTPEDLERLGTS